MKNSFGKLGSFALLASAALVLVTTAPGPQPRELVPGPGVHVEDVRIPVNRGYYTIAARILRPEGPGPFGAVILSHGADNSYAQRLRESPTVLQRAAEVFVRAGYVVTMPVRRGFGATGGYFAEDAGPCKAPDYFAAEQAASADVMAAYRYTQALPYVDPQRMVLAGQSAGGIVSLFAAGTQHPSGLRAVLAFAAGRGADPQKGTPCAVEPVAQVFEALGRKVQVPVLFVYAENDRYFNPRVSRLWVKRFQDGGARAEYVLRPAFGTDGHNLFSDEAGARYWAPAVQRFLEEVGLPFAGAKRA